jgi:hypothetical protein
VPGTSFKKQKRNDHCNQRHRAHDPPPSLVSLVQLFSSLCLRPPCCKRTYYPRAGPRCQWKLPLLRPRPAQSASFVAWCSPLDRTPGRTPRLDGTHEPAGSDRRLSKSSAG